MSGYDEHRISQAGGDGDDDAPKQDLPNEYPQHMPRGSWLWPDDRTGMEWADKHDERL
ncbi:MAG TPA: hypothetical protein VF885_16110 [Arthrobacter sp.]